MSKDKHAFLYDPKWQLSIVINGQLLLMMLTEWVVERTSHCEIIFENTDGVAVRIKRSEKHIIDSICKEMEELCGIALEAQECQKLIMRDVNNYINIISDDNIKFKGCFEIDRDYHKNHSKRIVALAVANYFVNNIKTKDTVYNHLNHNSIPIIKETCKKTLEPIYYDHHGIFDFCIGVKMTSQNKLYSRIQSIDGIDDNKLAKVTRYYVSEEGNELIKKLPPLEKNYLTETDKHPDNQLNMFDFVDDVKIEPRDRETNIEAGWKCTVFNQYIESDYDINYEYYMKEINKIIKAVENGR